MSVLELYWRPEISIEELKVVYSAEMPTPGFWMTIWEDLRVPIRDHIKQVFYLALVACLEIFLRAFDFGPSWLAKLITIVFHGLTVTALGYLAIPMAIRMVVLMIRSCIKAVREP